MPEASDWRRRRLPNANDGMGPSSAVLLLHLRRLDRFLKRLGFHRAAHTLERESLVHFDAAHLQKLVRKGRWSAFYSSEELLNCTWSRYYNCCGRNVGRTVGDGKLGNKAGISAGKSRKLVMSTTPVTNA